MKLLFQNPEFHKGLNISVRRGIKWSLEKTVTLADLSGNEYGEVKIDTLVFRFCDLTDADVEREHDIDCQTIAGLLRVMKGIYPTFDPRELVTIITFQYV